MDAAPLAFACPACRAPFYEGSPPSWSCGACSARFPVVSGIPLLLPNPEAVLDGWRGGLDQFNREMTESARHVLAAAVDAGLPPKTRARLLRLGEDLPRHVDHILALFGDAGIFQQGMRAGVKAPVLLDYYSLIHRDCAWAPEVDEVTPSVESILSVLPTGFRLGRTLVLGAGTGKLAWDLGLALGGSEPIVALDINPLPFLVTQKLLQGEKVRLFELPGQPLRSLDASREREIEARAPSLPHLRLVFGDGLLPPFQDGSFDTVITPWFVDQVPKNAADLLGTLERLLVPGGAWINHGPLIYDPARTAAAHRYTQEEFLEIVRGSRFRVSRATYESELYMASPLSSQARRETVLTFHAALGSGLSQKQEPSFLTDAAGLTVVPPFTLSPTFQPPLPIFGQLLALCDGTRGVRELARRLVEAGDLADDGTAEAVVRGVLRVILRTGR
jgi:hypothetical protein